MSRAEELAEQIMSLYEVLKTPVGKSPEGLLEDLNYCSGWLIQTSEMIADAEQLWYNKRGEINAKFISTAVSPTVLKEILNAESNLERRLLTLAERLNAALVHRIDAARSQLSYEKELRSHGGHQ